MADDNYSSEKNVFVFMSNYEHIKDYPLYQAKNLLCFVMVAYLLFVLKIGPDFMKNRKPYTLITTLRIYNLMQMTLSSYFTYLGTNIFLEAGFMPSETPEKNPSLREKIAYFAYVYWIGKVTELLDTVFFVLRKKHNQLTFLHIYHHSSVIVGDYILFNFSQSMASVYVHTNLSLAHVLMYSYYFASSFGPKFAKYLTWKKNISDFLVVLFITMFFYQVMTIFFTTGEHAIIGIIYILFSTVFFIILFKNWNKSISCKNVNEEKNHVPGLRMNDEKIKAV